MKPEPKGNTPRQSFRLTDTDNQLIAIIMKHCNLPSKTDAIRRGLIMAAMAAMDVANVNSIIGKKIELAWIKKKNTK
jgi:hypothetical protein